MSAKVFNRPAGPITLEELRAGRLEILWFHVQKLIQGVDTFSAWVHPVVDEVRPDREEFLAKYQASADQVMAIADRLDPADFEAMPSEEAARRLAEDINAMHLAGMGAVNWAWSVMSDLGQLINVSKYVWPIEDAVMAMALDVNWLRGIADRNSVETSSKGRVQRMRARRKAGIRIATIEYHSNDIETLRRLGFLPLGDTGPADEEQALGEFIALSLEVASTSVLPDEEDAEIPYKKDPGGIWRLRRWVNRFSKTMERR